MEISVNDAVLNNMISLVLIWIKMAGKGIARDRFLTAKIFDV